MSTSHYGNQWQAERGRPHVALFFLLTFCSSVAAAPIPPLLIQLETAEDAGLLAAAFADLGVVEPVFAVPPQDAQGNAAYGLDRWQRFRAHDALHDVSPEILAEVVAERLAALPVVQRVEHDGAAYPSGTFPNDPRFAELWALHNTGQTGGVPDADIDAPEAWDLHTGGGEVIIAIVDSGITEHPDLQLVGGWNTYNNTADTVDRNGHGTHVAGSAGAVGNNATGIVGVSWNVRLMPVKCMSDGAHTTESVIAAAIVWAADHGARVINLSLGSYDGTAVLRDSVAYAYDGGRLLVASAGSDALRGIAYPAKFPKCLAVSATDAFDQWGSFNSYGAEMDLAAPGVGILSTHLGGKYVVYTGTSMAAPHVSGLAALLWSYNPRLSNARVEQILKQSAEDRGNPGWDERFGWGRINAHQALLLAFRGDSNCDGVADFGDINPFVLALSDPGEYKRQFPRCDINNADCNNDGQIDFGDVNALVALLAGD